MAAPFIAWSHSRRQDWLECPKMFYHKNVLKKGHPEKIEFKQTPAMMAGLEIDNALTDRISKGTPLPEKYAPYEGVAAAVIAAPGQKFTQLKVALDQAFKPCGYMDWNNTWVRSIYDFMILNKEHAHIMDWKNGQIWVDESQLKLFAATAFHTFPETEVIDTSYVWLMHGCTSDKTYRRRDLPDLWADLLPDVERMQVAFKNNHWPAQPKRGKNSCKRCDVNKAGLCREAQGPFGG